MRCTAQASNINLKRVVNFSYPIDLKEIGVMALAVRQMETRRYCFNINGWGGRGGRPCVCVCVWGGGGAVGAWGKGAKREVKRGSILGLSSV